MSDKPDTAPAPPRPAPLHPDFLRLPIAHRGLHGPGVPENSLAAFRAAIEGGYGIELDIQHSAEGEAVVFHDYDLARMVGSEGFVADVTLDELAKMRLGKSDEGIPTLAAVLREVAGKVPLLIEIKDQDGRLGENIGDLQDRVATVLAGYDGPVAVMSFNPETVTRFSTVAPQIASGLVSCAFSEDDWPMLDDETRTRLATLADVDRSGSSFISHDRTDLGNPAVASLKARGIPVLAWTIRTPEAEATARQIADNITFEGYPAARP
ncbi:phosphodiesterase [Paracoccus suum]|uniref:Phosphodiesterase n=1 Tax=Paracoccus suum TaxID=2259340 RepID=A0A344PHK6_9RHOB|nr:glycerophosphodiester phosphodiesterase family protein [Paracoccus suum]AXC48861.1 phosphodiesterase [Paracoccus suum]